MKKCIPNVFLVSFVLFWFSSGLKAQESVSIIASKDNTIYDHNTGNSNGAGSYLFTGTSKALGNKRALLSFNVNGAMPANSVLDSAVLKLHIDKGQLTTPSPVKIHRLNNPWGEGESVGASGEGGGDLALSGDATWSHSFVDSITWENPGGDFESTASASINVSGLGKVEWRGSGLLTDINLWLADSLTNKGWILIGEENISMTSKRYISKDHPNSDTRPSLTLYYHSQAVSSKPFLSPGTETLNAYPNPFREELSIRYKVPKDEYIELGIYNLLGQQIMQVNKGFHSPGTYYFTWDGKDRSGKPVPTGMYYIIFVKGEEKQVLKILKSK